MSIFFLNNQARTFKFCTLAPLNKRSACIKLHIDRFTNRGVIQIIFKDTCIFKICYLLIQMSIAFGLHFGSVIVTLL
jgi:hypothetical protein